MYVCNVYYLKNLKNENVQELSNHFTTMCKTLFIFYISQEQINIREQIPKYLNGQAKLLTTRCIIIETEKIAKKTHGALNILKQYGIHECNHKDPVLGSKCILSMIGKDNEQHYILASQDRNLQDKLRLKAGVPLLYFHNKSPTLEKPSKISYDKVNAAIEPTSNTFISESQCDTLNKMKKALGIVPEVKSVKVKRKKTHNPNPLSCKKKKKSVSKEVIKSDGKIRKRNRKNNSKLDSK